MMPRTTLSPAHLLALSAALCAPQLAGAQQLFLSAGQSFSPGAQPEVRLEAPAPMRDVTLRLYQLPDPAAYFDKQADLHRPAELVKAEETGLSVLSRGVQAGLAKARKEIYGGLTRKARWAFKAALPDLSHRAQAPKESSKLRIKRLSYPLVKEWLLPQVDPGSELLKLPVTQAGVYLLEAATKTGAAHTVVVVSEIALVTKQSPDELLVWAVNSRTGAPLSGVSVQAKVLGEPRATGETDQSGLARLKISDAPATVLYAKRGADFSLLDPRYYASTVDMPRTYLFTDRPVYRPEQQVHVMGFSRDYKDGALTALPKGLQGAPVELTVTDARGKAYIKTPLQAKLSNTGNFDLQFKLPKEASFGTWTVRAKIGEHRYSGEFKLLAFQKPQARLSVNLNRRALRSGDPIDGQVVGRFFSGAAYAGAKLKLTATRTRFYVPWYVDADYSWYFAESEYHQSERQVVGESECTLDGEGRCSFHFEAAENSKDYTYVIEAVGQDPGGKTIIGVAKASVTQGAFYLAVEPARAVATPGEASEVVVRALTHDGKPVQTEVTVTAGRQVRAADGALEWAEDLRVKEESDAAGVARFSLKLPKTGYYALKATAHDDKDVRIEGEGFLFSAEEGEGVALAPSELMLVTDKKSYFVGDTAQVLLLSPSPETHALFSVEGAAIDRAEVVQTKGHAAILEVKIGQAQSPNFFLSAAAMIGGELYTRRRSVIVPPRERLLTVEVSPNKEEARPATDVEFKVTVKDYKGAPVEGAEVALTVVDEAIYDVSPELVAPIEAFFYPRRRDNVRTTDSFSFSFFGRVKGLKDKSARHAPEGAFVFGSLKPQLDDRVNFRDSAGFFPNLKTDKRGVATAKLTLPDNVTTWRATARAITPDARVGSGKGKLLARTPVVVRASFPSHLTVGDKGQGLVQVQNLSGEEATFKISLETTNLVVDWKDKEINLKNGGWGKLPFLYEAEKPGAVQFLARAESPSVKDSALRALKVSPWETVSHDFAAGRTSPLRPSQSYGMQLPAVADRDRAELAVTLTNSGLGAVQASLPYLVTYPHGCVEQTMSRFVPLLAAKRASKLLDMPEGVDMDELVQSGLNRLAELQRDDGGWGWFSGQADPFMSALVLEGLSEAKRLGAPVDADMLKNGGRYLRTQLHQGRMPAELRAVAAYALSRQGRRLPRMVSRLIKDGEAGKLSGAGAAYTLLAAKATKNSGLIEDAKALLLSDKMMERPAGSGIAAWCTDMKVRTPFGTQGCTALALLALSQTKGPSDVMRDAENYLIRFFDGEAFGPTLPTGLAARALTAIAEQPAKGGKLTVYLGEQALDSHSFAGAPVSLIRMEPKIPHTGRGQFKVVQEGPGRYFHTLRLSAPDRQPQLSAQSEGGLFVSRSYRPVKTQRGKLSAGRGAHRFEANELVLVQLEIEAEKPLDYVMISDPRPANFNPVQRSMGKAIRGRKRLPKGVHREHGPESTDFFLAKLPRGRTVLSYLARAGLPGQFKALPTQAEAMYEPEGFSARSDSDTVEVR